MLGVSVGSYEKVLGVSVGSYVKFVKTKRAVLTCFIKCVGS